MRSQWSSGVVEMSSPTVRVISAMPATSSWSIPSRRQATATPRYMAPVSRYPKSSRRAASRAVVDLPDPDGPSMATIALLSDIQPAYSRWSDGIAARPYRPAAADHRARQALDPVGGDGDREVADLSCLVVLDREILDVDAGVADVREQPCQSTGSVRDLDDDVSEIGRPVAVLTRKRPGPLPAPRDEIPDPGRVVQHGDELRQRLLYSQQLRPDGLGVGGDDLLP